MCNIPGQAHSVDSQVYSFCGQLFTFHTFHRQCYLKKTRQLIKKESTRTQITKDCFISLHWIKLNIILSYICVVIYWEILHGLRIKTNLRKFKAVFNMLSSRWPCCFFFFNTPTFANNFDIIWKFSCSHLKQNTKSSWSVILCINRMSLHKRFPKML